jgi:hypothetical protein
MLDYGLRLLCRPRDGKNIKARVPTEKVLGLQVLKGHPRQPFLFLVID